MLRLAEVPEPDAADALALALTHAQENGRYSLSAQKKYDHLSSRKLVEVCRLKFVVGVNGMGYEVLIPLSSYENCRNQARK